MAQTRADVARIAGLGVKPERIVHTGSIKFDQEGLPDSAAQVAEFRQLLGRLRCGRTGDVILAGSTHDGEEKTIAEAYLDVKREHPNAYLVVVPRHAERAPAVAGDLRRLGLNPLLKTELNGTAPPNTDATESCLIVNTTGELHSWYHLADIVLIGKSFLAEGGQNPVEPLAAGKPVIMGPNMQNFAEFVGRMVAANACIQLSDVGQLPERLKELAGAPAQRQSLVANVREVLDPDQGAAQRSARLVLELLGG